MWFIEFVEYNDHEGEMWRFWLQVDGNEAQINQLENMIEESEWYELGQHATEQEVDTLVHFGGSSYMDNENKVKGRMIIPNLAEYRENPEEWMGDQLYKGGIKEFFTEV